MERAQEAPPHVGERTDLVLLLQPSAGHLIQSKLESPSPTRWLQPWVVGAEGMPIGQGSGQSEKLVHGSSPSQSDRIPAVPSKLEAPRPVSGLSPPASGSHPAVK